MRTKQPQTPTDIWRRESKSFKAKPRPEIGAAEQIVGLVCATHGIERGTLLQGGSVKNAKVAAARAEAASLMRRQPEPLSYPTIAKVLNWTNHTTAMLAVRRHETKGPTND